MLELTGGNKNVMMNAMTEPKIKKNHKINNYKPNIMFTNRGNRYYE